MDKTLLFVADRRQSQAFADGGNGGNRDARRIEIGGLANQMLGLFDAPHLSVPFGTAQSRGDDHRDV